MMDRETVGRVRLVWVDLLNNQVRAVLEEELDFRGIYGNSVWPIPLAGKHFMFVELWQLRNMWLVSDRFVESLPEGIRYTREGWRRLTLEQVYQQLGKEEVNRKIVAKAIEEAVLGF
ncbi:MAG: hypothetical protein FJY85_25455, partial [Deltaproteobacteria bacterium]|nr:hypothetical protein [Deltaproteobacteria bacterium]